MRHFRCTMDLCRPCDLAAIKTLACRAAVELGASAVRVADAADDSVARRAMSEAFSRGDFVAWPYDAEYAARAASPESLLPGARSVIAVAVPYRTHSQREDSRSG